VEVSGDLTEQIVDAANDVYGSHPRTRALHAKGLYCDAVFTASGEAAGLSRAPHLQGGEVPALVRLSIASGDPDAHDGGREGHGIAVRFDLKENGSTDLLCSTSPTFVARTPEDFLELLRARRPDPRTGQADLERLAVYLERHPEAVPAIRANAEREPPASFATLAYNSLHAFRLVKAGGEGTWLRYRWEPPGGERRIPDEEAMAGGRDRLREELELRLADGPAGLELWGILAEDGDPLDDPTAPWPEERERVRLGTLELRALAADPEADGGIVVFDPVNVVDGIELPEDPILFARTAAYGVSAARRAQA
jgi:catalase